MQGQFGALAAILSEGAQFCLINGEKADLSRRDHGGKNNKTKEDWDINHVSLELRTTDR
jgi:hypothetical protein